MGRTLHGDAGGNLLEGDAMKWKVSGFVAHCKCRSVIAASSTDGMTNKEVSDMLVDWFARGLTVEPMFGSWSVTVDRCKCKDGPSTLGGMPK